MPTRSILLLAFSRLIEYIQLSTIVISTCSYPFFCKSLNFFSNSFIIIIIAIHPQSDSKVNYLFHLYKYIYTFYICLFNLFIVFLHKQFNNYGKFTIKSR